MEDTVEDMAEEMVINRMTEAKEAMGTQESQKTITGRHMKPLLASTLKKLQIYQLIQLQFKKTFMLRMKQPLKDRRKMTINLWKNSRLSASDRTSQEL